MTGLDLHGWERVGQRAWDRLCPHRGEGEEGREGEGDIEGESEVESHRQEGRECEGDEESESESYWEVYHRRDLGSSLQGSGCWASGMERACCSWPCAYLGASWGWREKVNSGCGHRSIFDRAVDRDAQWSRTGDKIDVAITLFPNRAIVASL